MYVAAIGRVEEIIWLPYDAGLSAAAETLVRILMRVIVSPAVYPRFLEIAELARSLCHSWATCIKILSSSLNTMLIVDKHSSNVCRDEFSMPQTDRKVNKYTSY